jgi:type IV pilus assembly protein PilB
MRRVCKVCRQSYEPDGRELDILGRAIGWKEGDGNIYRANRTGCPSCGGKGYRGRIGIHELMQISELLIEGINKEVETAELKRIAMYTGMYTLHQDSMKKVRSGISTMEEAIATVPPDLEDLEAMAEEFALKDQLKAKAAADRKLQLSGGTAQE